MTRELLLLLLTLVLFSGLAAVVMKSYLLYKAIQTRHAAVDQPATSPERIVADDLILDNAGRIVLALVTAGLGAVFVYIILDAPEPPDGTYVLTQTGIALLILLIILGLVEVLQGLRGVVNLQRLTHALEEMRKPPEACLVTTFEACPFISPERKASLQAVREKAQEIADTAGKLEQTLENPHGHA